MPALGVPCKPILGARGTGARASRINYPGQNRPLQMVFARALLAERVSCFLWLLPADQSQGRIGRVLLQSIDGGRLRQYQR
jgi:hypothetical protein